MQCVPIHVNLCVANDLLRPWPVIMAVY